MATVVLAQLRNLRLVLFGGGPDPAPLLAPADPAWQGRAVRILLVVAAALLASFTFWYETTGSGTAWVVSVLSALPLALVGYRPLLAWRIVWLLGLTSLVIAAGRGGQPSGWWFLGEIGDYDLSIDLPDAITAWSPSQILVLLMVLFAVGTAQHRGVLLWVAVATLVLTLAGTDLTMGYETPVSTSLVVIAPVLAGYLTRLGARAQRRLAESQERGTVLTERARIARELHDVVAHHMSMIAVRAETAPYRLADLPATARTEFAEISDASREALAEMRRLLGVLRSEETGLMTAPQPGLSNLPGLVAAARAAGAEVTVDIDHMLPDLPAAVDVSAYRIVQEALTNAARHAPGASVRVVVGRAAGGLALSIRNGPGGVSRSEAGPGHGVTGMRERATMLGGEFRAGPVASGGFEVSAVLPLRTDR
jgi:signal transduction histidine kinase